jgi:hypothetical protein
MQITYLEDSNHSGSLLLSWKANYPWEDRLSIELQGIVTTVNPWEDRLSTELQGLVTTVYPWEDCLSIELSRSPINTSCVTLLIGDLPMDSWPS